MASIRCFSITASQDLEQISNAQTVTGRKSTADVGGNAVKERHGNTTIKMTLQVHDKRSDADAWATALQEIASRLNSKVPTSAAQLKL